MEVSHHQTRPDEPELDLYTIPSQSSWFVWDEIHETERVSLREFFDESSSTRTPKIYKEYRDFIINKYREEPSRRLSFTEVRKSLVGDVNLLRKVFVFLENRGLINFSAAPAVAGHGGEEEERSRETAKVRVSIEEGVPNGIRVAAMPNSIKPITPPETTKDDPANSGGGGGGVKLPPLASFSDVFADLIRLKDVPVCGNCGERCNSGQYKYTKGDSSICVKCFESKNYGENKTIDDYKFTEVNQESNNNNNNHGASWTEAETLLLLDSVLKHGEDWNLVAQNLPTKTKPDCISKLVELPLGDVLGPKTDDSSNNDLTGDSKLPENQETVKIKDQQNDENSKEIEQNGDTTEQGPPLKRQHIDSFSGPGGGSLMEQVSRITTMVDPQIAAAAAEAAISSLCEENSWPREIFDYDDDDDIEEGDFVTKDLQMRDADVENSEVETRAIHSENPDKSTKNDDYDSKIPLTLRIRTAVATALGSAAARAKLLADQEEREIENLMATIISAEVKKLHCKMKSFEYLEALMKKKRAEIEETEDILLSERVEVLKLAFKAGVSTWKNHSDLKP